MPYIISSECIYCGSCESACPRGAIFPDESQYKINQDQCNECGNCVVVCPEKAIKKVSLEEMAELED